MNRLFNIGLLLAVSWLVTSQAAIPSYTDLHHHVDNHEIELRMMSERLTTQENIIDSLRQQLFETNQKNRDLVKNQSATLEARLSALESSVAGIIADLKQMHTHANDTTKALSQYKQNASETDRNLEKLHENLNALLKALQADVPEATNTYRVQNGDSLEKIARKNNTTVKKLKDINNLSNDKIIIGQVLNLEKNDKTN